MIMHERFRQSIERKRKAKSLFKEGLPVVAIAKKLGLAHSTVSGYIWGRARKAANSKLPSPKLKRAKELRNAGQAIADIQKALGVSRATVYRWLAL